MFKKKSINTLDQFEKASSDESQENDFRHEPSNAQSMVHSEKDKYPLNE